MRCQSATCHTGMFRSYRWSNSRLPAFFVSICCFRCSNNEKWNRAFNSDYTCEKLHNAYNVKRKNYSHYASCVQQLISRLNFNQRHSSTPENCVFSSRLHAYCSDLDFVSIFVSFWFRTNVNFNVLTNWILDCTAVGLNADL